MSDCDAVMHKQIKDEISQLGATPQIEGRVLAMYNIAIGPDYDIAADRPVGKCLSEVLASHLTQVRQSGKEFRDGTFKTLQEFDPDNGARLLRAGIVDGKLQNPSFSWRDALNTDHLYISVIKPAAEFVQNKL